MKKLILALTLILLAKFSPVYAQNNAMDLYKFNCRTYLSDGYLLSIDGNFEFTTMGGVVEVKIMYPGDYTRPDKMRFSINLDSKNLTTKKYRGIAGYAIEDEIEAVDASLKIYFAKDLADNSGEFFFNDDSYELFCSKDYEKTSGISAI